MKKIVILFALIFSLICSKAQYQTSKVIRDSILGKPKFVKEYVIFLNDSGPYTFMYGDGEYGHATSMEPENLRESMEGSWFGSNFCRYINNETHYDKNRNITKETWYYKSGEIVDDYIYSYDNFNRLITEKTKNKYSEHMSNYFYNKDDKTAKFKEYYSKWENEPLQKYVTHIEDFKFFSVTKYDMLTKTDSIFAVTNYFWKKVGEGYTESRDSIYHEKLMGIKIYNNQYKVVDEKFFDYTSDHENKKITLSRHLKYEYDNAGSLTKQIEFKNGKINRYIIFENGKIIREEEIDDDGKITYSTHTVSTYTADLKLERKTIYRNDKISYDIRFEYKNNHISKLYYLDKFGREDKQIEPTVIIFKYKFDKQKNWTEIIKNVDGKDLYKWVREIEYYK